MSIFRVVQLVELMLLIYLLLLPDLFTLESMDIQIIYSVHILSRGLLWRMKSLTTLHKPVMMRIMKVMRKKTVKIAKEENALKEAIRMDFNNISKMAVL